MNTLESIREALPGFARDLQLNLGSVLTPAGAPGLSERQIWAVALAAACASRNADFTRPLQALAAQHLDAAHVNAAHAAAAIMAMNNVYYRFLHLVEDDEYAKLPARLRMSVIGSPGIAKADFELLALAVSAINGCGSTVSNARRCRARCVSPRPCTRWRACSRAQAASNSQKPLREAWPGPRLGALGTAACIAIAVSRRSAARSP